MKKILIITTGGTIAMKYDPEKGVVPANSLADFLATFPQLPNEADIDVFEYSNLPSPHITPQMMFDLAKFVDIKAIDYDGIVITHGTDTIEETAYLFDLVLTTRKPVVLTAAMRSGSELGLDGPRNIVGAVRTACSEQATDQDVLVVMNDEIHAARDVTKSDTGKLNSFISPSHGSLGTVDTDRVLFHRRSLVKESVWTDKINTNVELIRSAPGMDGKFIKAAVENNIQGIVIEAFGRGNIPPTMLPELKKALQKKVVVVICSRAFKGRVLPDYGYEGGGRDLQQLGCILAEDLMGHKARLKLMALLGKFEDSALVKKFFNAR